MTACTDIDNIIKHIVSFEPDETTHVIDFDSKVNFDNLVINSMSSLFNMSITHGDYYFIFACIGIIKSILRHINGGPIFDIDND